MRTMEQCGIGDWAAFPLLTTREEGERAHQVTWGPCRELALVEMPRSVLLETTHPHLRPQYHSLGTRVEWVVFGGAIHAPLQGRAFCPSLSSRTLCSVALYKSDVN